MTGIQQTFSGCGGRCASCWCLERCGGCRSACSVHNCWDDCTRCLWTCCQDRDTTKRDRRRIQIETGWDAKWEPFEFNPPDLITQVNGRIRNFYWPMYAVSIKMLINWRQSMDGHPFKWRDISAREVCQIPEESQVVLTFTARDPILDWFYIRMKEPAIIERIKSWGVDYAFAVNFSHYLEMPRMEQIVNTARTMESLCVLQEAGVKVVPQVQWVDLRDRDHWIEWLNREKPCAVAINIQMLRTTLTHRGSVCTWSHYVDEIAGLIDAISPDTKLVMQGVSIPRRLALLRQRFGNRVVVMSGNPWCLANYGLGLQDGKRTKFEGWNTQELFIRNARQLLEETNALLKGEIQDDTEAITKVPAENPEETKDPNDIPGQMTFDFMQSDGTGEVMTDDQE